jgi:hypothetical protein
VLSAEELAVVLEDLGAHLETDTESDTGIDSGPDLTQEVGPDRA